MNWKDITGAIQDYGIPAGMAWLETQKELPEVVNPFTDENGQPNAFRTTLEQRALTGAYPLKTPTGERTELGDLLWGQQAEQGIYPKEMLEQGPYSKEMLQSGMYTPGQQRKTLSQIGQQAGAVAQSDIAARRGYLESTGMGNSIAGARLLAEPGTEYQRNMANAATNIEREQAQSIWDVKQKQAESIWDIKQRQAQSQADAKNVIANVMMRNEDSKFDAVTLYNEVLTDYNQAAENRNTAEGNRYYEAVQLALLTVLSNMNTNELKEAAGGTGGGSITLPDLVPDFIKNIKIPGINLSNLDPTKINWTKWLSGGIDLSNPLTWTGAFLKDITGTGVPVGVSFNYDGKSYTIGSDGNVKNYQSVGGGDEPPEGKYAPYMDNEMGDDQTGGGVETGDDDKKSSLLPTWLTGGLSPEVLAATPQWLIYAGDLVAAYGLYETGKGIIKGWFGNDKLTQNEAPYAVWNAFKNNNPKEALRLLPGDDNSEAGRLVRLATMAALKEGELVVNGKKLAPVVLDDEERAELDRAGLLDLWDSASSDLLKERMDFLSSGGSKDKGLPSGANPNDYNYNTETGEWTKIETKPPSDAMMRGYTANMMRLPTVARRQEYINNLKNSGVPSQYTDALEQSISNGIEVSIAQPPNNSNYEQQISPMQYAALSQTDKSRYRPTQVRQGLSGYRTIYQLIPTR